jgi:hypothetical protein
MLFDLSGKETSRKKVLTADGHTGITINLPVHSGIKPNNLIHVKAYPITLLAPIPNAIQRLMVTSNQASTWLDF